MGLIAQAFRPKNLGSTPVATSSYGMGTLAPQANFQNTMRAYLGNEIVAAGLNLLAKSASEPHVIGRRYRRARPQVRAAAKLMQANGTPNRPGAKLVDAMLVMNGYWEEVEDHPLVRLLNNPNPYTSRGQMWALVVLDIYLAGNSYLLKARYTDGMLNGAVGELYRLRPDRMKPIAGNMAAGEPLIKAYEYTLGAEKKTFEATDIIHFKSRNPMDPFLGIPLILPLLPRVDIDTYMRRFLATFFERGGAGIGAILNLKGKSDQATKDSIRERLRRMFGGGVLDVMVTSADEATYTPLGLNRGLRDALPKEIDAVNEARMGMVMGIPGAILGLLIGYETSSYANQRQAWQIFWDITMAPLLSDFDDVLNLSMVPEFGGIDEVCFDLSDIHALQEDEDAFQERARKNVAARIWTMEEGRLKTGVGAANPQEHFLLPDGSAVKAGELDSTAPVQAQPAALPPPAAVALLERHAGRPRLEDDADARMLWGEARTLMTSYPNMTNQQIAGRLGISERSFYRHRDAFSAE